MLVPSSPTNHQAAAVPLTPKKPLVHVIEDEAAIRTLFANIGEIGGFDVTTYSTVAEFFSGFSCEQWGCLVIDLNLPDGTGIEILEKLSSDGCNMPVVFMSGIAKVSEAVKAFKLGTLDFVEKPFELETMLEALHRAIDIDREQRASSACIDEIQKRFDRLSPREQQVMEFVVRGSANKEVASHLGLSPKTVEVHRANVMRKTEATSVAELVRMHVALTPQSEPASNH